MSTPTTTPQDRDAFDRIRAEHREIQTRAGARPPQPSAGAKRAASLVNHMTGGFMTQEAEHEAAQIIDRETGAGELAERLRRCVVLLEDNLRSTSRDYDAGHLSDENPFVEVVNLACATLAKYAPTP